MTELQTASMVKPWAELEGRDRHAACMLAARDGDKEAFDALVSDLAPLGGGRFFHAPWRDA